MLIFDQNYLLYVFLPTLILSLAAQGFVMYAYNKWSKTRNSAGITGAEVAQRILRNHPMIQAQTQANEPAAAGPWGRRSVPAGVSLERSGYGPMTDHYDPRTHTVRMSDDTATKPSVASMAIVAHELGHAQQHSERSIFITLRNFLVPAMTLSPQVAMLLIFGGLLLRATGLIWAGILVFGVVVIFMLFTLPVEIDASLRGLRLLSSSGLMLSDDDQRGSRQVLTAAALTYVAAAITAILQLLYYVSLAQRRR